MNIDCMETMIVNVMSARIVVENVHAIVRAVSPPCAVIHLQLVFPPLGQANIWEAARDEALKYLDIC